MLAPSRSVPERQQPRAEDPSAPDVTADDTPPARPTSASHRRVPAVQRARGGGRRHARRNAGPRRSGHRQRAPASRSGQRAACACSGDVVRHPRRRSAPRGQRGRERGGDRVDAVRSRRGPGPGRRDRWGRWAAGPPGPPYGCWTVRWLRRHLPPPRRPSHRPRGRQPQPPLGLPPRIPLHRRPLPDPSSRSARAPGPSGQPSSVTRTRRAGTGTAADLEGGPPSWRAISAGR